MIANQQDLAQFMIDCLNYADGEVHLPSGPASLWLHDSYDWFQHCEQDRTVGWRYPRVANSITMLPEGTQIWYQNGQKHRADGPAVIYPDGTEEFWYDGVAAGVTPS